MGEKLKERKQRSDKKKQCKPTVSAELYQTLDRVSYITRRPIKTIAETLLQESLSSGAVMDLLADQLVRDYWIDQTLYVGSGELEQSKVIRIPKPSAKVSMRLNQRLFNQLVNFSFAIGKTHTSAAGELLRIACVETSLLQRYVETAIVEKLDDSRKGQLKEVLRFINRNNPHAVHISLFSLLDYIVTNFKRGSNSLKEAIDDYLNDK